GVQDRAADDDRAASSNDAFMETLAQCSPRKPLRLSIPDDTAVPVDVPNKGVDQGQCRIGCKQLGLLPKLRMMPQIVRIKQRHELSADLAETKVQSGRDTAVLLSEHVDALIMTRESFGDRRRCIGRPVVNEHNLQLG